MRRESITRSVFVRFQIKSSILLPHLLQRRGVTDTAAFADDEFVHRISDGRNERRLHLALPHRAALAVVLLELEYAQAYAVDNESIDSEGALTAPAAANAEEPLFPVLDLVLPPCTQIVSNDQPVEVGAPILADLQNDFCPCRQTRELPRPKHTNSSE